MKQSSLSKQAKIMSLLGNQSRLEIASLLHGHELTVNQVVQMTGMRQAAVSQHLATLKSSYLVSSSKIGKEIYYSLISDSLVDLRDLVTTLSGRMPLRDDEPTVVDPICQMQLTPNSARYTDTYNGVRHYFCGRGCHKQFVKDNQ